MLKLGLCLASGECSGTLGSCRSPQASLMQLKSLKQKASTEGKVNRMRSQLAGFQKFTDEMVAKFGGGQDPDAANANPNAPAIDLETRQAVRGVHEYIQEL